MKFTEILTISKILWNFLHPQMSRSKDVNTTLSKETYYQEVWLMDHAEQGPWAGRRVILVPKECTVLFVPIIIRGNMWNGNFPDFLRCNVMTRETLCYCNVHNSKHFMPLELLFLCLIILITNQKQICLKSGRVDFLYLSTLFFPPVLFQEDLKWLFPRASYVMKAPGNSKQIAVATKHLPCL